MEPGNDLIFISIASYRDAQLVPTLEDLIDKADQPQRLRFGICWQHAASDPPLPFYRDNVFRILDVDFRHSRGACWARAEIMKLWQGEAWFLQVDSHCRFASRWDTRLIRAMEQTGSPRPILSTYANPFTPVDPAFPDLREVLTGAPQLMALGGFSDDGLPLLKPLPVPTPRKRSTPMRARFLSAGFLFAPGSFVHDVPYDPDLYFFGEESAMTLRAFTSGYDLFHPVETIVWHDYVRTYATRHWEDHIAEPATQSIESLSQASPAPAIRPTWGDLDLPSRQKVRRLLTGSATPLGPNASPAHPEAFSLGSARTLQEYEAYAGISFLLRKAHDYTRLALEPPNPTLPPDWPDRIYPWLVRVVVDPARLPAGSINEPGFWLVAIHDADNREIYRRDFLQSELDAIQGDEPLIAIICEFESGIVPASWVIWPFSRADGWRARIVGPLAEADYAILEPETA